MVAAIAIGRMRMNETTVCMLSFVKDIEVFSGSISLKQEYGFGMGYRQESGCRRAGHGTLLSF